MRALGQKARAVRSAAFRGYTKAKAAPLEAMSVARDVDLKTVVSSDDYLEQFETSQWFKGPLERRITPLREAVPMPPGRVHFVTQLPKVTDPFELDKNFVKRFETVPAPFGFNGLGEFVFLRTYSRTKADGSKEKWHETVERVVNGTFRIAQRWLAGKRSRNEDVADWDDHVLQTLARDMYERIFDMKMLPPGRGLWAMGTTLTEDRDCFAALNNCAFVSTKNIAADRTKPFCFLMDCSMLGVGVGFDTRGAGLLTVYAPRASPEVFLIPDSREGWVESVRILLDAYFTGGELPSFDYSIIRAAGEPIRGFGGVSQGPGILMKLHKDLSSTLDKNVGSSISVRTIVDIMNVIGVCVVAGNVRRTAEIAFGDPNSEEYVALKDYDENPDRMGYGWTSNNSVFAKIGMDYKTNRITERIEKNGEPGFAWLENMKMYSRTCDEPSYEDVLAEGGNPCLEQTLESYEMCNLVETFPCRHEAIEDFHETLRVALLYGKLVALGGTHWEETNNVMWRNRRVGISVSGIAQFIAKDGIEELRTWLHTGYEQIKERDEEDLQQALGVLPSVKCTSIKPSGTVSLLAGATPGLHHPESEYYIRRIRLAKNSDLIPCLRESGLRMEDSVADSNSVVVEFPVHAGDGVRTVRQVSMWEQLSLAAFLQRWWADNQVSCTVSFDPEREGPQLPHALDYFQYQLKGISFLPLLEQGAYPQMPYEEITKEEYIARSRELNPLRLRYARSSEKDVEEMPDRYCETDSCKLVKPDS